MSRFPNNELVDMVFILGECLRNPLLASRVYRERYPDRRHPDVTAFENLLARFVSSGGSVAYSKPSRDRSVLSEHNKEIIMTALVENPRRSAKQIGEISEVSRTSVWRTIKSVHFHPYRFQKHQKLLGDDRLSRLGFCRWVNEKLGNERDFFNFVLFTDESTFHNDGFMNSHNYHHYSDINPHLTREVDRQHRWSLNTWGGILGQYVVGPFFFDRHLNSQVYSDFLRHDLPILLEDIPLMVRQRMWFQHDGAPAHYGIGVRNFLNHEYPQRWIGRGGPVNWPPRSPDITKPDFFLWGYVKERVYEEQPTTADDMRNRIREAFRSITPEMLENVNRNFANRVRHCLQNNGGLFEATLN